MYNLYISEVFCSFLLTSGLPDVSDEDTQRSLDGDLAYSVHIRSPHIAEGKRSSHVVTIGEGESPSSPQTSSTPKIRQENTVPTTTQQTSVPQKKTPPVPWTTSHVTKTITVEEAAKKSSRDEGEDLQVAYIHSEMSCVRENIEKLQKIPHEVHLLRNSIDSVHGDINTVGASCVKVKSDVTSILEEVRDADKIAHDIKTHVLGLHAETNNLKGDIHGLKSKTVEVKVISQGAKDELSNARVEISSMAGDVKILKEDVTSVEGKINIMQADIAHIKHEMGLIRSDVSTVKHDMGTVKSSIGNINRGISEIKSALVSRCDKVDQAVGTDTVFLEEVKSDPGTGDEGHHMMVPREYQESPERRDDNLSGLSSLNTSEVQFKPSAAFLTYHKERLRAKRSIGEVGPLDSEIDAIPDTESHLKKKRMGQRFVYDTQTQPSEDKETQETDYTQGEESQEDPGLSQEQPGHS